LYQGVQFACLNVGNNFYLHHTSPTPVTMADDAFSITMERDLQVGLKRIPDLACRTRLLAKPDVGFNIQAPKN